jgi:hypothetical protein
LAILPFDMKGPITAFTPRGLSPHQFTPMSGAHKALDRMRGSAVSRVLQSSVTGALPLIGQLVRGWRMKRLPFLLLGVFVLVAAGLLLFRPSRPTIYYQPPSVKQSDIVAIQNLVRSGGDRHFSYIVFSTLDSNQVQVLVNAGMFHRARTRLYWIRRVQQAWQIERVGAWEDPLPPM